MAEKQPDFLTAMKGWFETVPPHVASVPSPSEGHTLACLQVSQRNAEAYQKKKTDKKHKNEKKKE